ncbi:MAG: hypothetical protein LQ338_007148 [Usnochroma carphineum]|nr:MAG: hypothetical protein LQ338_007148 [Usnochroma carphineum]
MAGVPIASGFSNWVDFESPISSITELWNLKERSWMMPLLTGLLVTTDGQPNRLLGRGGTAGKRIELQENESVTAISVISANQKQPFKFRSLLGIELKTSGNKAVVLGFTGVAAQASLRKAERLDYPKELSKECLSLYGKLDPVIGAKRKKKSPTEATYYEYTQRPEANYTKNCIVSQTTEAARLTGLIWTTHTNRELNTIRALWDTPSHESNLRLHQLLCPSLCWSEDPPPHIRPRPVPNKLCAGSKLVAVPSDAGIRQEMKDIVHIRVYATAVLHGLRFRFANGGGHTFGLQEGKSYDFDLRNRQIIAVDIHDLFDPNWIQPDNDVDQTVFVQAIKIGYTDLNDQVSHVVYSALLGADGVPNFSDEEKGDYVPWAERSHNLVPRTRKLELQEGTSFAGLWAEVLPL